MLVYTFMYELALVCVRVYERISMYTFIHITRKCICKYTLHTTHAILFQISFIQPSIQKRDRKKRNPIFRKTAHIIMTPRMR